jgi:molybdenum cofactor cytidylyltransferase
MRYAIIPAGGHSTRMGRPKLSLPLGNQTVLERVITTLREGGVAEALVVIGPHVPELVELAQQAGAHTCLLAESTPDMRATVEAGLHWLEQRFAPQPHEAWLLVPADHPTLDPSIIRTLEEAQRQHPECSVFIPTFQGQRGHPTALRWKHVPGIRQHPRGEGLNLYLRQQHAEIREVAVSCPDILCDLDTPADYERVRGQREKP